MPNPITNFKDSNGVDLGNKLITKEYLMSVYPQIAGQIITPELWVWGLNSNGQLGTNNTITRSAPVNTFAGGANWKQLSCGTNHTAAIKNDGTLWVWGLNFNGQLGINSSNSLLVKSTPVTTFAGGNNWKQVSCGADNTAAIKTDGTLWTWGKNSYGQLGINNIVTRSTPVTTFAGRNNWKQVSSSSQTAAIKTDGTLWVWGFNANGQLGINNVINRSTPVTTFAGGTNWKQVSSGGRHIAAIKTDGTLWMCGFNVDGQLGINNVINRSTPVTTFAGGTNWKQVSAGGGIPGGVHVTEAIKTDGTLWVWGDNSVGTLGTNNTTSRSTPVTTFAGGTNWKQVSVKTDHSAAIKTDGTLWLWGSNSNAQLGINNVIRRSTPVTTFAGGNNWKQVSSGWYNTIAIKSIDYI